MNKMLINMYIVHAQNQSTDQMNSGNGICENTKLLVLFIFILTLMVGGKDQCENEENDTHRGARH